MALSFTCLCNVKNRKKDVLKGKSEGTDKQKEQSEKLLKYF